MKSNSKEIDMLHGPLLKKILVFALPLALSSMMQQLFNSIDVAVVGHFASREALAAVGSNGPVINLLINLFIGVSMGATVVISNHIGQKDDNSTKKAISTAAFVAVASGIFLMFLGFMAARPILEIIDTPDDVLDLAELYLRIYFCGMPFLMVFNFAAAILRSIGDTKRPLYILIAAGVVNALLNLLLVVVFHMSVAGVAIATCIANAISATLIVRILISEAEPYKLDVKGIRVEWKELKRMLQIGVPAGIQGMIFSFSNVLMQSAINGYGSAAIAGSASALNYECYCYFIVAAFSGAAISFVGQNYGAGNMLRVKRIYWICMALSFALCCISNLLIAWQHDLCLSAFSTDGEVLDYGSRRMMVVLTTQWIACSYEISGAALRGMGRSMLPTLITIVGTCLLRIFWIFVVARHWHGFQTLMGIYPVSWMITGCMMLTALYLTFRKMETQEAA